MKLDMDCLPVPFLSQWNFPILHLNLLLKLIGPKDTFIMVDRYMFLLTRIECWLDRFQILVIVDDPQVFIFGNGTQKWLATIYNINALMAIDVDSLHCSQLISQPLQPVPGTVLGDCCPNQVQVQEWLSYWLHVGVWEGRSVGWAYGAHVVETESSEMYSDLKPNIPTRNCIGSLHSSYVPVQMISCWLIDW